MTTLTIINGVIKLIVVPGTEIERMLLEELCKGPVEVQMHPTLTVGDKQCANCISITPAKTKE